MPDFYSPNNIDPEDPYTCRCLPIKYVVAMIQLAIIILSVGILSIKHEDMIYLLFQGLFLLFMIGSFAAYSYEQKHGMLTHFYCAVMIFVAVFVLLGYYGFDLLLSLIMNKVSSKNEVYYFFLALFVFCGLIYYLHLCYQLLKAVARKTATLPEFDTTQGLFTFSRDHYDGSETANLLYPQL